MYRIIHEILPVNILMLLFLKFKDIVLFDKANIQFRIDNNSCEVKVH
jgi:hypothetical protein